MFYPSMLQITRSDLNFLPDSSFGSLTNSIHGKIPLAGVDAQCLREVKQYCQEGFHSKSNRTPCDEPNFSIFDSITPEIDFSKTRRSNTGERSWADLVSWAFASGCKILTTPTSAQYAPLRKYVRPWENGVPREFRMGFEAGQIWENAVPCEFRIGLI
jgi:hypothetical protein